MVCLVVIVCQVFSIVWGGGCKVGCFYFFLFLVLFCCVFRFCKLSCKTFLQFGSLSVWLARLFVLLIFIVVVVLVSVWVHMAMALAISIALINAMACDEKGYSSGVVVVGVVSVASTVCC